MTTAVNPFKLSSFSAAKHIYLMQFDVEKWYTAIQPHTFETHFVPLAIDEARAMAKRYKSSKVDDRVQLTEEEANLIEAVNKKISVSIDELKSRNKTCFVRLSSRSPKDAGLDGDAQLKQLLNEEINDFKQKGVAIDSNVKLQALFNASARLMEVSSAEQAMNLLLSSERIYTDLCHAIDQPEEYWDMKIIIREFVKLDVSYEFRGFVCKRVLTALSQYNDMCYYPHLKGKELEIVDKIFNFFNTTRDLVQYDACIVDFVIMGDDIKIIEINPFGLGTGASLFDWHTDRYLLQGGIDLYGDLPNEINVTNEVVVGAKGAKEPVIAEFTSTSSFENGWKTILRVNNRIPDKINSDYVNTVYGDILNNKTKGGETLQKLFKTENNNCTIL